MTSAAAYATQARAPGLTAEPAVGQASSMWQEIAMTTGTATVATARAA